MANKKQQLPQGQITPVARPLGSFIQPGQQQTAGAAAPPNIPNPINTTPRLVNLLSILDNESDKLGK